MKFLMKELALDKVEEEQDVGEKVFINTPPPVAVAKPNLALPVSFISA